MILIQTNKGNVKLELFEDQAPETCANFRRYVENGFYDGTIFHRVIKGFMIQGGGFTEDMSQKKSRDSIKNEADNGLGNEKGTIAMARTSDPHSASNQFFINVANNAFLNFKSPTASGWGYCVFGKVIDGMDVVEQIEAVATGSRAGHQDVPTQAVIMEKVELIDD
ncbi:MAG: peptidyl-prolyl cis-trans isomerase [Gammaproteobacteria bacterium]|nr:peptidyl-prolyl cis-trans isomerase [Gammaproteobacteria bacterium]